MKIADVLGKLVETVDHLGGDLSQLDEKIINPGRMVAVIISEDEQPDNIYVPPLQLKLELLKKAAGVESIYDDKKENKGQGAVETYGKAPKIDEVGRMRKLATLINASDDEPLDD